MRLRTCVICTAILSGAFGMNVALDPVLPPIVGDFVWVVALVWCGVVIERSRWLEMRR